MACSDFFFLHLMFGGRSGIGTHRKQLEGKFTIRVAFRIVKESRNVILRSTVLFKSVKPNSLPLLPPPVFVRHIALEMECFIKLKVISFSAAIVLLTPFPEH